MFLNCKKKKKLCLVTYSHLDSLVNVFLMSLIDLPVSYSFQNKLKVITEKKTGTYLHRKVGH